MFGNSQLPIEFSSLINAELEQGEKVIWQDQPEPYYFSPLSRANLWGGIVALFVISFVVFNIILDSFDFDNLDRITGVVLALFMVAFLTGIAVSISSPLRQYRRLTKTVYLLTNRRAMEIFVRRKKPSIRSWPIDTITQIRLEEENISFGSVEIVQGVRVVGYSSDSNKGFFRIQRAGEVARLLGELMVDEKPVVDQEQENNEITPVIDQEQPNNQIKPVVAQEQPNNQLSAHIGSQQPPEEGLVGRIKSLFMYLLDNSQLFRTLLVFLIIVLVFGTPIALGWITNTGTAGFFFFLIFFAICGLINPMRYQGQSRHWPSTEGVVEESWVAECVGEDSPRYKSHVLYRYQVGYKIYRDNSIDTPGIGDVENLSKIAAEQKVAPYPEGTQVTVYYDPKRPWFSVLEAGEVDNTYWIAVIILLPLLVCSGYYMYTTWPGFEPSRYRALWEEVMDSDEREIGKTHGSGEQIYLKESTYSGELKDGKKHGKGTLTWPSGTKYIGEFEEGGREGRGEIFFMDGAKYIGEWKNGKRNGKGIYTFSDGDRYSGEWKDGKKNGKGTYTWSDGTEYTGEFRGNKINGYGEKIYSDGDRYIGEWKNAQKHGKGIYTYSDGRTYEGIWYNGERQEKR